MYTYTHPQCVSYTHSKTETLNTNKHKKVHVWGTTLTSWTSPLGWIETLSASWFKLASEMQNSTAFQKITSSGLHNTVCACLQFCSVLLGIHLCSYWNEMVNKDVKASFLNTCLVTEPVIKFEQLILMLAARQQTWKIKMKRWQCRRSLSLSPSLLASPVYGWICRGVDAERLRPYLARLTHVHTVVRMRMMTMTTMMVIIIMITMANNVLDWRAWLSRLIAGSDTSTPISLERCQLPLIELGRGLVLSSLHWTTPVGLCKYQISCLSFLLSLCAIEKGCIQAIWCFFLFLVFFL